MAERNNCERRESHAKDNKPRAVLETGPITKHVRPHLERNQRRKTSHQVGHAWMSFYLCEQIKEQAGQYRQIDHEQRVQVKDGVHFSLRREILICEQQVVCQLF
jgi:hypothetical protein